ncbi:MAG: oligosaccharide flippase family protein [Pseudomonadota bacterium]
MPLSRILPAKLGRRLDASPLASRIASGTLWSAAGTATYRGLSLLAYVVVARVIGREQFGGLGVIQSTAGMLVVFAGFGLGLTATHHVASLRTNDPARAGRVIALSSIMASGVGAVLAAILYLFAPWLASQTLADPGLVDVLRASSWLVLFGAVNAGQSGALSGFEAFRALAIVNLVGGVLAFPIVVGGALVGRLLGAVWGMSIVAGVVCVFGHMMLRREMRRAGVPVAFAASFQEWRVLGRFSLPAMLTAVVTPVVSWTLVAILVNQPRGYAEMGVFNAATQLRTVIMFVPAMLATAVLPALSQLHGRHDGRRHARAVRLAMVLNGAAALAVALPVCIFGPWLLSCYGPSFTEGVPTLVLVAASTIVMAITHIIGQAIVSAGQMWWGLLLNCAWALSVLIAAHLLRGHGAFGLAEATLLGSVVHLAASMIYAWRRTFAVFPPARQDQA